jgi:hypothetical protein
MKQGEHPPILRKMVHLDIPELLLAHGWPDTTENRKVCAEVAEQMMREQFPEAKVIQADKSQRGGA